MMKHLFFLLVMFGLIVSCNDNAASDEVTSNEEPEQVIAEKPVLAVATFDIDAADYVDTEVSVTGIVDHVCKHGGKRLLLVVDGASVHVDSETRFEDEIVGQEVTLNGIVREERIDESSCLKMEEDNIKKHTNGEADEDAFEHKNKQIQFYRDSMATAGIDHLSFYTLDFVSFNEE